MVRYRSKKKQAEYRVRGPLVARLLEERPACEACEGFAKLDGKATYVLRPSRDIHEIVRRSQGGSILDVENLMAVCGICHARITEYRDGREILQELGFWQPGWTLRNRDGLTD